MSYFQRIPLELTDEILDYLDAPTLHATLRTATFLRHTSERKLYRRINLDYISSWTQNVSDRHARLFDTVFKNDRLALYVVKLELGDCDPIDEVIRIIGQALKKMVNLKDLYIHGYNYIHHAHLDSVPFSLRRLLILDTVGDSYTAPELPVLSILRAHPNLEELVLGYQELISSELVKALEGEQDSALPHRNGIICPRLKRFDGPDEALRLFLPMRKIESGAMMGCNLKERLLGNDELVDTWLTPALISSYQHLRTLEVWPYHSQNPSFLTIMADLTSLTHLHIVCDISIFLRDNKILLSMGKLPTLRSITLTDDELTWFAPSEAHRILRTVSAVCPNAQEVFLQEGEKEGELDPDDVKYYRYTKGGGFDGTLVGHDVARRPYTAWLYERCLQA